MWLVGFGATAPQTYNLDWRPVAGESHTYHISVNFDYTGVALDFESDLETKVLGVAKDGSYRLELHTRNATVESGDDKKVLPPQNPSSQRYSRRGLPLEPRTEPADSDPFADLLDHLTEFETPGRPVIIGDTWLNAPGAAKVTYKLQDISRSKAGSIAHIRYTAAQGIDPYAATGDLYLARPQNSLSRVRLEIPRFQPEGANVEASVHVKIDEVPVKEQGSKGTKEQGKR